MVLADKVLNARRQQQRLIDRPGPEGLAHKQTQSNSSKRRHHNPLLSRQAPRRGPGLQHGPGANASRGQAGRGPVLVPAASQYDALCPSFSNALTRDCAAELAERGIAVSYETVRRWVNHFGPTIATELRKRRPRPHSVWHLDEVYLRIDGRMVYLWRAVDVEGEVLDVLVQSKRNKHAALKLMRKLLKKYAFVPERLVTDDLRSYSVAVRELGIERRHERGQ